MKKYMCVFFILLIGGSVVHADNLQLSNGTVFKNVTIISADPDRMLIVHDGGGCQVDFKDLKPDSLTAGQRVKVEDELRYYALRTRRMELIRLQTEEFEAEQRRKGLLQFEDGWVTPAQRENILQKREERKLELERQRVALAKERAALEKEQLQTEKARALLEGETQRGTTYFTYGYTSRLDDNCFYPVPYRYARGGAWTKKSPYISTKGADAYNRGPMNR
ncbi:hypothetical protein P4E94_04675 [Pontiellaceae bacterium B12219]|nr:hypothetical protein [Pontiellaceae bacterium B12219]